MRYPIISLLLAAAVVVLGAWEASAQLSNRPFAFSGPKAGVGISVGGKQAMLNKKLDGVTPKVLVRDAAGELVDVGRAPASKAAIARRPGGNTLPGFRRTDWRRGNAGLSVGTFNAFFVPRRGDEGFVPVQADSGDVVNTWTTRVVSGNGTVVFRADSPVDVWTGAVSSL